MCTTSTNGGLWKRFRKGLSKIFSRSPKTADALSEPEEVTPEAVTVARADRAAGDRPDDDGNDGNGGNGGTTGTRCDTDEEDWTAACRRRTAELQAERMRRLCAESRSRNRRTAAELCDARRENVRLFAAACELEEELCELKAKKAELEDRHVASRTAERERAAEADVLNAENRRLKAAVSESRRRAETAVRSAVEAISAAKSSALAARERYDAAVRRTKRLDERAAARSAALSATVVRLQSVLSSSVADLRPDVLRTLAQRLRQQTETETAG